jgi:hypothetical protein
MIVRANLILRRRESWPAVRTGHEHYPLADAKQRGVFTWMFLGLDV